MTTATKPHMRPEALEAFRYRRRYLRQRRKYLLRDLAQQIEEHGAPKATTSRRLRHIEAQIRAYNEIAAEYGLQHIR